MNYLEKIIRHQTIYLMKRKREKPLAELRLKIRDAEKKSGGIVVKRNFIGALTTYDENHINIIAEIKKASPSKGDFLSRLSPEELLRAYERGGACAISIVTEPNFFKGSLPLLTDLREKTNLPILRKDFIIDAYQLYESKAAGADAVLLIARILSEKNLRFFTEEAASIGLHCVIEIQDENDIKKIASLNPSLPFCIGINARDLTSFTVDLQRTLDLAYRLPIHVPLISESGIQNAHDVQKMRGTFDALLIGETLITSKNPKETLTNLLNAGRS